MLPSGQREMQFMQRMHRSLSITPFSRSMQPAGQNFSQVRHLTHFPLIANLNSPVFASSPSKVPTGQTVVQ